MNYIRNNWWNEKCAGALLELLSLSQNGGEGRGSPSPRNSTISKVTKQPPNTYQSRFTLYRTTWNSLNLFLRGYVDLYISRQLEKSCVFYLDVGESVHHTQRVRCSAAPHQLRGRSTSPPICSHMCFHFTIMSFNVFVCLFSCVRHRASHFLVVRIYI